MAFVMIALTSCLPDENASTSDTESSITRESAVSESHAATLLSSATKAQNAVLTSAEWTAGLAPGVLTLSALTTAADTTMPTMATSGFDVMTAYCEETTGTVTNRMLLVWMDNGAVDFSLKGLGANAGAQIARSLGAVAGSAGVYDGTQIQLLNPRAGGVTSLALPTTCAGVSIPNGAPLIVLENMTIAPVAAPGVASLEYKTEDCALVFPGQVGNIIYSRLAQYDEATGQNITPITVPWTLEKNNCTPDVVAFSVDILPPGTASSGISVAGIDAVSTALSALNNIACRTANSTVIDPDSINADTCANISTSLLPTTDPYGGLISSTSVLTGAEDNLTETCTPGDLSSIAGSYGGLPGVVDVGIGWVGSVTFKREYVDTTGIDPITGLPIDARQIWIGDNINCTRDELLTLSCSTSFPGFNVAPYVAVNTGGVDYTRTNIISGWADPNLFIPNSPWPTDINWNYAGVNCSWREVLNFDNCAAGHTPTIVNGGTYERLITATSASASTAGAWTPVVPSICTNSTFVDNPAGCAAGYTGFVRTTTGSTSTADFPWVVPTVTTTTTVSSTTGDFCSAVIGACDTSVVNGCSAGTLNDLADTATDYLWECVGATTASCSIPITPPIINGACGVTNNACTAGTLNDLPDTGTTYEWQCLGSGVGATTASCSIPITPPIINGACGGTNNACTAGTLNDLPDTGTTYEWQCLGSGAGATDASCSSLIAADPCLGVCDPTPGVCNAGTIFQSGLSNPTLTVCGIPPGPPYTLCFCSHTVINGACDTVVNGCTAGSLNDTPDTGTDYLWECVGSGVGATTASCTIPIAASCGCGMVQSSLNVGLCVIWEGPNGAEPSPTSYNGTNGLSSCGVGDYGNGDSYISCSCTPPPPINGVCGAALNTCSPGFVNNTPDDAVNYLWDCVGQYGGSTANCSSPRAAYSWRVGSWGACSASCGGGTQTRVVECIDTSNAVVPDANCTTAKPIVSQPCNTHACSAGTAPRGCAIHYQMRRRASDGIGNIATQGVINDTTNLRGWSTVKNDGDNVCTGVDGCGVRVGVSCLEGSLQARVRFKLANDNGGATPFEQTPPAVPGGGVVWSNWALMPDVGGNEECNGPVGANPEDNSCGWQIGIMDFDPVENCTIDYQMRIETFGTSVSVTSGAPSTWIDGPWAYVNRNQSDPCDQGGSKACGVVANLGGLCASLPAGWCSSQPDDDGVGTLPTAPPGTVDTISCGDGTYVDYLCSGGTWSKVNPFDACAFYCDPTDPYCSLQ